jgi:hypothetical protein
MSHGGGDIAVRLERAARVLMAAHRGLLGQVGISEGQRQEIVTTIREAALYLKPVGEKLNPWGEG